MKKMNDMKKKNLEKRVFPSGAIRNNSEGKFDYSGFINPAVENSFARYMHKHREMEDGTYRNSDDWQFGIPSEELIKCLMRHIIDVHLLNRGYEVIDENGEKVDLEECLNAVKFNVNAYILNLINNKKTKVVKRGE